MPSISSVAPSGCDAFFEGLRDIKSRLYPGGRFQLQFSIHTTDEALRDRLIPVKKWGLDRIGSYGAGFREPGDRKITLNFALARGTPIDPDVLARWFDPGDFLVKITPINPTHRAVTNGIVSHVDPGRDEARLEIDRLRDAGYEVLLSIGELEENRIGSNCGQYIQAHLDAKGRLGRGLGEGYACVDDAETAVALAGRESD
jgi:23S rRNA (adenine2503-C2)-methyltransferase